MISPLIISQVRIPFTADSNKIAAGKSCQIRLNVLYLFYYLVAVYRATWFGNNRC